MIAHFLGLPSNLFFRITVYRCGLVYDFDFWYGRLSMYANSFLLSFLAVCFDIFLATAFVDE